MKRLLLTSMLTAALVLSPIAAFAEIVDVLTKDKFTYVTVSTTTPADNYFEWTSPDSGIKYHYNAATEDKNDYIILSVSLPIISTDNDTSRELNVSKIVFNINDKTSPNPEITIFVLTPDQPFQSNNEVKTAVDKEQYNKSIAITNDNKSNPIEIIPDGQHKYLAFKNSTGRTYLNSITIYYEEGHEEETAPAVTVTGSDIENSSDNTLTITSAGVTLRPVTTFCLFEEASSAATLADEATTPDKSAFTQLTSDGITIKKPGTLHIFTRDANGNDSEIKSYTVTVSDLQAQQFTITNEENFTDKAYTCLKFPETLVEGTEVSLIVNDFSPVAVQGSSFNPAQIISETYSVNGNDPYPSATLMTVQSELSLNNETAKSVPQYYISTPKLKIQRPEEGSETYKATIRHGNTNIRYIISDKEPSQFDPAKDYATAGQTFLDTPLDILKNQYITVWAYADHDGYTLISPVATYTIDDSFLVSVNTLNDETDIQWFTLDGIPLESRPTVPGIYIRRTSHTTAPILINQ